jgi:glyoxylase-like metal-dependent hydrolase (beta-lactamase superfamily II)
VSRDLPAGITLLLAPNPSLLTGAGTNTYVVAASGGCVVIDPGPAIEAHLTAVAEQVRKEGGASAILVTHGHPDHEEGAVRLRELIGAPVLAWSRDGVAAADGTLADGAVVCIGATAGAQRLIALHTPGHRFDHLSFLLEESGTLFAGDLVAGAGTVVIAPPEGDLTDYLASLQRLLALELSLILPAHGPIIEAPRALLEDTIQHRQEREDQVLAALAAGDKSVAALVARIYAEVSPALHPLAAQTVTAHLLKLAREGRVVLDGDDWRLLDAG